MEILFPAFPDALREPDPAFYREWQAVEQLGLQWRVFGFDALLAGDLNRSLQFLPPGKETPLLYRGWILKEVEHAHLHTALETRGYRPVTSPSEYALCTYLPNYFARVADLALPAVWCEGTDAERAWQAAQEVGPPAYVVKDYVKSAKEIWEQGCYVPPGAGPREFAEVCRRLVEYRGERFERGLVIRPFVPLRYLGESAFGTPIYEEYRLYFFRGELLLASAYDRIGGDETGFAAFADLPRRIPSPFFTADVARTEAGSLVLVELGDGGVSRLPPSVAAEAFYHRLHLAAP